MATMITRRRKKYNPTCNYEYEHKMTSLLYLLVTTTTIIILSTKTTTATTTAITTSNQIPLSHTQNLHHDHYDFHDDLSTNSELGKIILQQSRRVNNDDDGDEEDYTWMANFSLKYQGCNNIQQWNTNADDEYDVKIKTSRIARFRLCPFKYCSSRKSMGCTKGYGDYVVDINTYVSAYVEAQRRQDEYECQVYMYKHCGCSEKTDDDFDLCQYKCFLKKRKYDCIESNPYYDDDTNQQQGLYRNDLRDFEKYFEGCSEFDGWKSDRKRRKLEDGGSDDDMFDKSYYIGLYCADQGGKIYLGMFTDDTCTNFADKNSGRTTYKEITGGLSLPFSDHSMVRTECISCLEGKRPQEGGGGGYGNKYDYNYNKNEMRINKECQQVYQSSGKCETAMTTGRVQHTPTTLNSNACYFIDGIQFVTKDGFIDTNFTRPNQVISYFIFLFSVSFVLLGAYIYYLRMSKSM